MPVLWTGPGRLYRIAALCVSCGGCNATLGEECREGFHRTNNIGDGRTSTDRAETAEFYGFVTVGDAGPLFEKG